MKSPQRDGAEAYLPKAVVDLLKGDVLLAEHVTDVHPVIVPANSPVHADATHFTVARILERNESRWIRTGRASIAARWSCLAQGFMGTLLIELGAETIEDALVAAGACRPAGAYTPLLASCASAHGGRSAPDDLAL